MSEQDAADDIANHIARRSEILNYNANVDARLDEIELELRELAEEISDKTLLNLNVSDSTAGNSGAADGQIAANNTQRAVGGAA